MAVNLTETIEELPHNELKGHPSIRRMMKWVRDHQQLEEVLDGNESESSFGSLP